MAFSERLAMVLTANGTQAISEFNKVGTAAGRSLATAEDSTKRLGHNLTRLGAGMVAFGAVAVAGLYKAAQAAADEDVAIAKLNNSIAQSPELAGASSDAFLDQAAALQDVTRWSDDATIAAQAMLGTFHLTQDEILGLTPLVQDFASKFGVDLVNAAKLVGKALEGNIGALKRAGVRIDENAFATDRYNAVLTALRENAGGFAEEEGQTFSGQLEILKNNLSDVAEGLGRGAIQGFNALLGPVEALSDAFQSLSPATQSTIGKLATFGSVGLIAAGGISVIVGQVLVAIERFKALAAGIQTARLALMGTATIASGGSFAALAAAVEALAAAFMLLGDSQDRFGIPETEDAVTGLTQAMRQGDDAVRTFIEGLLSGSEGGQIWAAEFEEMNISVDELITALSSGEDAFNQWWEAVFAEGVPRRSVFGGLLRDLNEAWPELEGRAGALNELFGDGATSAEEQADAINHLTQEISDYIDEVFGVQNAQDDLQAAFQNLFEVSVANGTAWRENSARGRELRDAYEQIVVQAGEVSAALVEENASEQRLQRVKRTTIAQLRAARDAGLLSADAFRQLARDVNNIPGSPRIDLTTTGFAEAMAQIAAIREAGERLSQASFTAHLNIITTGGFDTPGLGHAHGGFIREGEMGFVHGGEMVSQHGGVTHVTPAGSVGGGGTVDLSPRSIRALVREMEMAGVGSANVSVSVRD